MFVGTGWWLSGEHFPGHHESSSDELGESPFSGHGSIGLWFEGILMSLGIGRIYSSGGWSPNGPTTLGPKLPTLS